MNIDPGQNRPRHLYVDVSVIAREDAGTGIQRVVRALWTELKHHLGEQVILCPVAATRTREYRQISADFLSATDGSYREDFRSITIRPGDIFLGLDLASHLLPHHERQIAAWKRAGMTMHIFVYDMLPYLKPSWFRRPARRNFRRWLRVLRRRADQLICISSSVADDVRHWARPRLFQTCRPIAISTIRLGSDIAASRPSQGLPKNFEEILAWASAGPCILTVGTVEPRKGHDCTLNAFEHLWRKSACTSVRLLIVGRPGWNTAKLQSRLREHPENGHRLRWIDNASDELLGHLYTAASGILCASRGEGLGLPLLEAAAEGKAILARNLPVFHELGMVNVQWFDDDSAASLAGCIMQWLETLSSPQSTLPSPLAREFPTWSDSACDLIARLDLPRRMAPASV